MADATTRGTKRRTPLTRERVLRAAVRLADKRGFEALSMRRLGEALGVEAMSLYKHVASKDEILDGVVDVVFGEIGLPAEGVAWRPAMRERALAARQVLLRHPWAIGLLDSRRIPGPATIRHHDAVIRSLRQGGFSIGMAAHAFSLLDSYIYGFALQETSLPLRSPRDVGGVATELLIRAPAAEYPHFAEMVREYARRLDDSHGPEFEYGLDLILDGLERAQAAR